MLKQKLLTTFQKFIKIEGFSGILLLISTVIALIWANSPVADSYTNLWAYKVGFSGETFELKKSLLFWINDLLMAIFFFLIGLEIKREVLIGELNSPKKIAFPLFAAVGGAVVPVVLFFLLNTNPDTLRGWGIPMATDIAFSLAVLNALGKRVPLSLKVFLIAFAIVDDIEAVLVIAIFYSGAIKINLLLIAFALLAVLYYLSYKGIFSKFLLILIGSAVWILFLKSGVHPTVAGILLAFSVPISQKVKTTSFIQQLETIVAGIKKAPVLKTPILSKGQMNHMSHLKDWSSKYQSPLQTLEHGLHNWVGYFIIPVFALSNAGVAINGSADLDVPLIMHIIVALVLGKGLGIPLVIFLAKQLKLIQIPADINFKQIIGVSFIAGIGFTMAIFIAGLAFANSPQFISSAKIGILIASFIAAIAGYVMLRLWCPKKE